MTPAPGALEALERQAARLRFHEPALEKAFIAERVASSATRTRAMQIIGILVLGGLGLTGAANASPERAAAIALDLRFRFLGIIPIWLVMLGSTFFAGHARRAGWLNAFGTTVVSWYVGVGLLAQAWSNPGERISSGLTMNLMMVLLVAAVILPMRFREVAAMVLAGVAVPLWAGYLILPVERLGDLRVALGNLVGFGTVVVALSWYREAAERLVFARREHMRALNLELARLNAEKNEFMAIASHDLRAPLASVRGLAEQLVADGFPDPAKRARAQAAIVELASSMLQLVNDFLGVHVAESGTLAVHRVRLNLQDVAAQAATRHADLAAAKQQRVEVAPGPPVRAWADAGHLAQVLDNFVTNALKYSPPGAAVRLALALAEDGSSARVEVSDTGPGLSSAEQARLFRVFSRAGPRPTGDEPSHGLGLAVTKRLAEAMGGHVGCESTPGAGATFWIELPRAAE
ncbi:MAG: HAMP domain-containing histidine kinase [Verrucomicrobia bacterium]|nr:HAMP domain-containing histidine kinase [Verrucomicrobiota bacterium]